MCNLKLKKHRTIFTLRRQWLQLEKEGSFSVYQSYFVQRAIALRLPIYAISQKYKPLYVEIIEDGKTVLIAPLCKSCKDNRWGIIGQFNGLQLYDFIYGSDVTIEQMQKYLKFLCEQLKCVRLDIETMPETSVVYQAFQASGNVSDIYPSNNVNISFTKTYEEYYSVLSKNMRQNIRTAYNRLNKDNCEFEFKCYLGTPISRKLLNNLIDVYCDRHTNRYEITTSILKKYYLKYFDFSTWCQQYYNNNLYAVIFINGEVAAFLSGLIDKKTDEAIIPRLSIKEEFGKYSPGIVLINEVVQYFINNNVVRNLNLSKGDEKYKIAMGGEIYKTYNFKVQG